MLAIVGNVVADHIMYVDAYPKEGQAQTVSSSRSCGGAALNVARAYHYFSSEKPNVFASFGADFFNWVPLINLEKFCYVFDSKVNSKCSKAAVISCRKSNTRTGLVEWGSCRKFSNLSDVQNHAWIHFSYCDTLDNLTAESIRSLSGIKSTDLTSFDYDKLKKKRVKDFLREINFIICAPEEAAALLDLKNHDDIANKLGTLCKDFAIVHSPVGSFVSDGKNCAFVESGHEIVKNIDVTGAGDTFAGALINELLSGSEIKTAVAKAHKNTCAFLTGF